MALERYKTKRNFSKTSEPRPQVAKGHRKPIFVIQKHHASRLHYDFRLEAGGVLKSWAVPKVPTLDPAVKRLAVHVEDHPLAYADFAGDIPAGQYGAGHVEIWDHGTYENAKPDDSIVEGIERGRLEFVLNGKRLHGRFALIHMKDRVRQGKDNWLLIKMKDEFAQHEPEPSHTIASANVKRKSSVRRGRNGRDPIPRTIAVTHPDKVIFPESGLTKADVADYYREVANLLLPHLRDRPATLERLPDGLTPGAPQFWQKDTPDYYPDWVQRIELPSQNGKAVHYALVNDLRTLMYLVNQGALTFHVWMSRVDDLDRPDFVLFDLDRGTATFEAVIRIAQQLRKELKAENVEGLVKTSGKTGLHILSPWSNNAGYDGARAWAMGVAQRVVAALPEIATVERLKAKRGHRDYIDVIQNALGHHSVPPYVLRAVPAATVSVPLAWREVGPTLDPERFDLKSALRRFARQKRDLMAALARTSRRRNSMKSKFAARH